MTWFSYNMLLKYLEMGQNFSTARYGDGEWFCLLRNFQKDRNTDDHYYYEDMGSRLWHILESKPQYFLGMQPLGASIHEDNEEFQRLRDLNQWELDNEMFPQANVSGVMHKFIAELLNREVLLVANKDVIQGMGYAQNVEIPLVNCWLEYPRIRDEIRLKIKENIVILYCASMMANVLIDDFAHNEITQIDVGSAFDPLVGKRTRKYHYKMNI